MNSSPWTSQGTASSRSHHCAPARRAGARGAGEESHLRLEAARRTATTRVAGRRQRPSWLRPRVRPSLNPVTTAAGLERNPALTNPFLTSPRLQVRPRDPQRRSGSAVHRHRRADRRDTALSRRARRAAPSRSPTSGPCRRSTPARTRSLELPTDPRCSFSLSAAAGTRSSRSAILRTARTPSSTVTRPTPTRALTPDR